jgi:hypothetical protein
MDKARAEALTEPIFMEMARWLVVVPDGIKTNLSPHCR